MTSDSVGSQSLRVANPAHFRPINPSTVPFRHHPLQSLNRELWNLNSHSTGIDRTSASASKRRRTGHGKTSARAGLTSDFVVPANLYAREEPKGWRPKSRFNSAKPAGSDSPPRCDDLELTKCGPQNFPQRPGRSLSRISDTQKNYIALENVQTKPYVARPPVSAPHFRNGEGPADFHPWTGHHAEDVLNESTTKNGLYDKSPAIQNESATARTAIWSSLTHKSGVQILSSLLVSALDQRQVHGTITANCTFKPPPRVTLTDTKREAWLRDLANPEIPLRRLSRTIPHGIRGKILLDHCLAKVIPTSRAVWLAKCVGANEIRAFKRKGAGGAFAVGGEAKWIKDWTANVEQFIEMIVNRCENAEWKVQMNYGLRLASHLASENLLDHGHYLNWVMSSVENSTLDSLSIWILMGQTHCQDLLRRRQHGRRLVEVLLEQLRKATELDESEFAGILRQLIDMVKSLILTSPACFISPQMWANYEPLLRRSLDSTTESLCDSLNQISRRNKEIRGQASLPAATPKQRVIKLLDMVFDDVDIATLADACQCLMPDTNSLVTTFLQWGSSVYRTGMARIYLSIRLLRGLPINMGGLDTPITAFLANREEHIGLSRPSLFRILAELFRSKHLNVGRYLQWLMARGGTNVASLPNQRGSCDTRLLFELPICDLSSQVSNLRSILLSKFGATVEDEQKTIHAVQTLIAEETPDFFPVPRASHGSAHRQFDLTQLSIAVKSTVARWVRQNVASRFSPKHSESVGQQEIVSGRLTLLVMTLDQFKIIRRILENLEDFAVLADVLKMTTESQDTSILTFACDTVNFHISIFAAIGALHDLFSSLIQQHKDISESTQRDQQLVESLIDLGKRIPTAAEEVRHLKARMQIYRQRAAAVACSPISDHMTEALQSAEHNFFDELDQVLVSGTSMDKQHLTQLFGKIVKRLEHSHGESDLPEFLLPELLARLRPFDPSTFEILMVSWFSGVLRSSMPHEIPKILPSFIFSGCIMLDKVLNTAQNALSDTTIADRHTRIAMDILELLDISSKQHQCLSTASKSYRLRMQYIRILRRSPTLVVPFLLSTVEAYSTISAELRDRAYALISSDGVQDIVKTLVVSDPRALQNLGISTGATALLDKLIFPGDPRQTLVEEHEFQLPQLLGLVNHYNMPLCRLKLKVLLSTEATSPDYAATRFCNIISSNARYVSSDLWPELVSELPPGLGDYVRRCLEREILSRISWGSDASIGNSTVLIDRMLAVVGAIGIENSGHTSFPLISQIADKFSHALSSCRPVARTPPAPSNESSSDGRCISKGVLSNLDVLLRLLNLHQMTVQLPNFPQSILIQLALSLSVLLILDPFQTAKAIPNSRIYDTLLVLSDALSDESRNSCIRNLQEYKIRDSRIRFIFGYSEPTDGEWLQLVANSPVKAETIVADLVRTSATQTTETLQPYQIRSWEMMQDATPVVGVNDTSLSLTLFGARKSVF